MMKTEPRPGRRGWHGGRLAAAGMTGWLAAWLVACGGGGGGGGGGADPVVVVPDGARVVAASAASDVTAANYTTLAPPLVRALLVGTSGSLLDPTAADREAPQSAAAGAAAMAPTVVGRTALAWLQRLPDPARRRAAAVVEETLACRYGGTIVVRFDDADDNGEISAGDRIGFTAQGCVEDPALPAIDGGFTMTVHAVELDRQREPVALDVSARFEAFSLAGFGRLDGDFRLWSRQETVASSRLRISFLGTQVTEPGGTVVYELDIDGLANVNEGSFEISGGIRIGGQTYAVATGSRLRYAIGQPPSSGDAVLRDAAGDRLRIVARSAASLDLEFIPSGATGPTAAQPGLRWEDFET